MPLKKSPGATSSAFWGFDGLPYFSGTVASSRRVRKSIASSRQAPHISQDGCSDAQTAGRSGLVKILQRMFSSRFTQGTPAGFPCGIPGMGDEMDGAIQHAPHFSRQIGLDMLRFRSLNIGLKRNPNSNVTVARILFFSIGFPAQPRAALKIAFLRHFSFGFPYKSIEFSAFPVYIIFDYFIYGRKSASGNFKKCFGNPGKSCKRSVPPGLICKPGKFCIFFFPCLGH